MSNKRPDPDQQRALERSAQFVSAVLAAINASGNPYIALHGLIEMSGGLAGAMIKNDGARLEWVIGMIDALRDRLLKDAAVSMPVAGDSRN